MSALTERERRVAELYGQLHRHADADRATSYLRTGLRLHLHRLGLDPETALRGATFLDAGCGGFAGGAMAAATLGARTVCAVDLSGRNVRTAKARLAGIARSLVSRQNLRGLGLATARFDFVFCNGVLHHTEDPPGAFRELVRVLKPGGRVYVGVYGRGGLYNELCIPTLRLLGRVVPRRAMNVIVRLAPRLLQPSSSLLDVMYVPIHRHYHRTEVERWCVEAGITPVFLRHYYQPESRVSRLVFGEGSMIFVSGVKPERA